MPRKTVSSVLLCSLCIALTIGIPGSLAATESVDLCTFEHPGNETTEQPLAMGAVCIDGTLAKRRHLFAWTVADDPPGQAWSIVLDGAAGRDASLHVQRLEKPSGGTRAVGDEIFGAETPEGGGSIRFGGLQFRPGTYLVTLTSRSEGAYRLRLVPGTAPALLPQPADSAERPPLLAANNLITGAAGLEHYLSWHIDDAAAQSRWTIEANGALGEPLAVELRRASGEVLVRRSRLTPGPIEISDLALDAGDYVVRVAQPAPAISPYTLRLLPGETRAGDREVEPNDTLAQGHRLMLDAAVTGRLSPYGDIDVYRFRVDEAMRNRQLELSFLSSSKKRREICLTNAAGAELQCRRGSALKLPTVALEPGDYGIVVSGEEDALETYTLTLRQGGLQPPDVEREPNDKRPMATLLDPARPMHGRLAGTEDVDFFRFKVTGEPQLWSVVARGRGVETLRVLDNKGGRLGSGKADAAKAEVEATGIFLLPGEYWIELTGKDADYAVEVRSTGPPVPDAEREPNDQDSQANALRVGVPRTGTLPDDTDRDLYRFSLGAPVHAALDVIAPEGADIAVEIEWGYPATRRPAGTTAGGSFHYEAWLEPGDYLVRLRAEGKSSNSPYRITLSLLDPFDLPADLEPNDTPAQARPLPASLSLVGDVGRFHDDDWYELPQLDRSSVLDIDLKGNVALTLMDGDRPLTVTRGETSGRLKSEIPAGHSVKLGIKGSGRYELGLAFIDGPRPTPASGKLPLQIAVDLGTAPAAAYWIRGQRMRGEVILKNTGNGVLDLALETFSSSDALRPSFSMPRLSLAPDTEQRVPIEVAVASDARADRATQIAVRARAPDGAWASARASVTIDPAAHPIAEEVAFPLPKALLGGINVAATAWGGSVVVTEAEASTAVERALLHDGLVSTRGFAMMAYKAPVVLTTRLAGDREWPIAGITLQPQIQGRLYAAEQLKDFELLLSPDGTNFEPVLSGTVSLSPVEQAFVLEKPVPAKAAQLRLKSNHAGNDGNIGLNEWKVIAVPGEPAGVSTNLADPARGGHVVWADPMIGIAPDDSRAMLDGRKPNDTKVPPGRAPQWVLGFHEDRAAQIAALEWIEEGAAGPDATKFSTLKVETSLEGPLGPWKELGTWTLQRDEKGVATWSLPEPVWARFVRFASMVKSGKGGVWAYPKALRVAERAIGADYLSILGEWGQYNHDAIFEAMRPPPGSPAERPAWNEHPTREARSLAIGVPIASEVRLGAIEDWYAIEIPEPATVLTLTATGEPTVDIDIDLEDASGAAIPLRVATVAAGELTFEATVKPGMSYRARVREPPRSVAIAYDTSGSLAPFSTAVYQAVLTFAGGVTQQREFVNFMNFAQPFLLDDWNDQPWMLQGALLAPHEESDSSDLPLTITNALSGLRHRRGVRAMIVVTDAETAGYDRETALWAALSEVRPRIFTAHVGAGGNPLREKQIMQDLAAVNGGFYASARTPTGMDVVAERAAAWLRRPARYQVTATVGGGPRPGTIAVRATSAVANAASAAQMAQALQDTGKVDIRGINFDVDKTIVKPSSAATLAQVAKLLKDQPSLTLEVGGHTDDTGGAEHNLKLSAGRAAAVVDALVKRHGIAASRLRAQGYGDTRPIATNDTDAGRGLNRRVELKRLAGGPVSAEADNPAEAGRTAPASLPNAPYAVIDAVGKQVLTGTVNGDAQEIAAGDYTVRVTLGDRKIERSTTVAAGSGTIVQVSLGETASPAPSDASRVPRPHATPPRPAPASDNAQSTPPLSGVATVLDTGTLVVAGKIVKLSGVVGEVGPYVDQMAAYVGRNPVSCRPSTKNEYQCDVSGQDLAKVTVFNGGGRAAPDAPNELKSAERNARDARRGIWQTQ
jgi:outer membrane protein OmpA-like peptidoglycan-associated protein